MTNLQQMRYYRSEVMLGKIAKHLGMDVKQAHEGMKENVFLKSTTLFED